MTLLTQLGIPTELGRTRSYPCQDTLLPLFPKVPNPPTSHPSTLIPSSFFQFSPEFITPTQKEAASAEGFPHHFSVLNRFLLNSCTLIYLIQLLGRNEMRERQEKRKWEEKRNTKSMNSNSGSGINS